MNIYIKLDNNISDYINAFPERVEKSLVRAVNRSLQGINTDSSNIIRKSYNVKKRDISLSIRKFKATKTKLEGRLDFDNKSIPLYKFSPSPKKFSIRKPKLGISVKIRKDKNTLFRSSFFNKSGVIFVREGKERLPIKKLYGPKIYQMINKDSREEIRINAERRLLNNFIHEIEKGFEFGVRK